MKVQLVTPYRVSLLQRYGVTVRDNVTSVYPPLRVLDLPSSSSSFKRGISTYFLYIICDSISVFSCNMRRFEILSPTASFSDKLGFLRLR